MAFSFNGTTPTAINYNGNPVHTVICNGVTVWSAAKTVTYYVDSGTVYQEDINYGASVLSPTTFTPSKSGYTFVGWREDTAANSSVLSSKTMGDSEITLYAVFKRTMTLTYYDNTTTAATKTGTQYYNNGNVNNPSVTLSQASKSGWTARGWSTSTAANAGVSHDNGATITLDNNYTFYGLYQQTITLSYSGNGSDSGSTASQSGTRYYNSSGNISNPSFTLASNGFAKTDNSFTAWAMGSTSGTQYAAGANVTLSANTTFYAIWKAVIYWIRTYYNSDGANITDIASGYPDEWTMTDYCCEDMSYVDTWYKKSIYAIYPTCPNHTARFEGVASGSTGGHKYAYIYITQLSDGSSLVANNTTITSKGAYTIDVSGTSTLNLTLIANGSFFINDIKFYS